MTATAVGFAGFVAAFGAVAAEWLLPGVGTNLLIGSSLALMGTGLTFVGGAAGHLRRFGGGSALASSGAAGIVTSTLTILVIGALRAMGLDDESGVPRLDGTRYFWRSLEA